MTPNLALCGATLPALSAETREQVVAVRDVLSGVEQIALQTEHILHGGMYARTIRLKPGVIISGVLIKRATILIVNGRTDLLVGDRWTAMNGYNVIPASAGRMGLYLTRGPVEMTMLFPTSAKAVEQAEAEFTDELDWLVSRKSTDDVVVITGE